MFDSINGSLGRPTPLPSVKRSTLLILHLCASNVTLPIYNSGYQLIGCGMNVISCKQVIIWKCFFTNWSSFCHLYNGIKFDKCHVGLKVQFFSLDISFYYSSCFSLGVNDRGKTQVTTREKRAIIFQC